MQVHCIVDIYVCVMKEFKGEVKPHGYVQLVTKMLDMLLTKKCVAYFDSLQAAEAQCLFELYAANDGLTDVINAIWEHYKEMVDLQDWWDNDL